MQSQVVQKPSFHYRCFKPKLKGKDRNHGNCMYGTHGNHRNKERCVATISERG